MTDKDQSSAAGQHGHSTSRGLAIKRVASPSDNLVEMLSLIRVRDRHVSRTQRVANLNILAKKVRETPPDNESDIEQVVYSVRWSLCSKVQEVRAGGLRVLRYLLINNTSFNLFMKYHLDKLVVRCLDSSSQHETERIQALRLMRQVLHVAVERFPRSFAASLVSISAQTNNSHDPLVWASVGTLCELALVNPKLAAQSGVVKVLLRMLLTCQVARINEAIVTTMLCLVNHPDTRQYMYAHLDIESVMAPITDLHYQFEAVELDMKKSLEDRETHVEASKVALTAMLKSWSGLIYLSQSGVIRTLLEVLPLADPFVQKALLEVFFDVFQIRIPEWTECFIQVLKSVETSQFSHDWMLDEGWIAEEGMYLLPPRITSRTNLVISYLSMLLVTLIKCGLSKAFTKLYERCYKSMEQQRVAVRATVLIGELIHFSSSYIPVELSHRVHCVPDLIASATQFTNHARRSLASQVVSCLDRVHQLKKKSAKPSSLFLDLILKQTGYHKKTTHYDFSQFVSQDFDDAVLLNIIRDTQVIHTKDYSKWNLDLVISLLQSPALQFSRLDDTYGIKFIKRLTNFFKPSNYIFTSISYNTQNMKTFSTIGCSLVNFLTKTTEGTQRFLIDLIADIVSQLSQVTAHKKTADVFTPQCIQNTLCRDYFLFIGYVSYQKPAVLLACNAYAPLLAICDIPNRNDLIKLIISSLDYGHDVYSRVILNKVLTASDQAMRLYATKHLGVLLRAKMQFFNNWGIQMLVTQLYDVDEEVAMKAVDILDEACEEESCLIALIIHRPALLHLAEKGVSLLTRFISTSRGFTLMKELGYLDSELLRWFTNYNEVYVQLVERRLAEAFTSYKCAQEGSYVRRSAIKSCRKAEVFVPIHFYGQLIQQRSGCELLKKKDHVKIFADIIRRRVTSSTNVLNTKAILWALGHIGSSGLGLDLLIAADIISEIVVMATSNPVFSIRGTCFYTLCLIAKTTKGVQQLKQLGWVSVCHSHEHKWPVVTNKNIKMTTPPLKKERSIVQQKSLPEVVLSEESPDIMAMKRRAMLKKSSSTMASAIPQKITEGKVFEDVSDVMATSQRTKGEFPRSRANNMSPQQRPISMISLSSLEGEMTSPPSGTDKPMTIGSSHKTSSTGSYLGLCVPLEYDTMYKFKMESFKGSWPASFPANLDQPGVVGLSHDPSQCLQCSYKPLSQQRHYSVDFKDHVTFVPTNAQQENKMRPRTGTNDSAISSDSSHTPNQTAAMYHVTSHTPNRNDSGLDEEAEQPKRRGSLAGSLGGVAAISELYDSTDFTSSGGSHTTIDSHVSHLVRSIHEEREAVRKDVLSLVTKLSSEVAARANTQGLNLLFEQYPETAQDVCLYSQVSDLLTVYQYSMARRRVVQSKFQDMTFDSIFPDDHQDDWSGGNKTAHQSPLVHCDSFTGSVPSSVVKQQQQRRRSSTGDLEQLQDDIKKSVKLQLGQTDEQTDISISNRMLLPVKIEAIGTPSSVDSAELNPITVVTQLQNGQAKEEDIIRIHHQSAENGSGDIASSNA